MDDNILYTQLKQFTMMMITAKSCFVGAEIARTRKMGREIIMKRHGIGRLGESAMFNIIHDNGSCPGFIMDIQTSVHIMAGKIDKFVKLLSIGPKVLVN